MTDAARRWPAPPDGALAAAIIATMQRDWQQAIALWRDQLRADRDNALAAACLADAALASGHRGLADQMLTRLDTVPGHLQARTDAEIADGPDDRERTVRNWLTSFSESHPLAELLDADTAARLRAERPPLSRRAGLSLGPQPDSVSARLGAARREGGDAVRGVVGDLLLRKTLRREVLHRAIVALRKAGADFADPLMRDAIARFDAIPMRGEGAAMAEARLYRGLGFPAFAQCLLREALARSEKPREQGRIRRRLARLAAERDRWADDADIVTADDFPQGADREAFRRLSGRPHRGMASSEPLAIAFDDLLASDSGEPRYEPENRLLLVGNTLACGGMERVLANSYRHFADGDAFDAVDIALLGFRQGQASGFYADLAGVGSDDVVLLDQGGETPMPFTLLPSSWKERAAKLFTHIARTRPRVVHAWNDLTGLLAAYAGIAAGAPRIIVHFHHGPLVPLSSAAEPVAAYPQVYRDLLNRPEMRFVFCSKAAARDYAQWWGVERDAHFCVIYNGFEPVSADLDRDTVRAAIGLPSNVPVIGWLGRFGAVKRPLVWAEAAIRLAASDAHFLMVGDGPLREPVAERFAAAGLSGRLRMTGQVTDVPAHLAAMDLLWQSSASEGLPNALIEAQLAGVPVLAFDVGGAGETFIDGETGLLVPPGDGAALADRTLNLLADSSWMERARRRAREQAAGNFSSQRFFAELAALYAETGRPG